MDIHIAVIEYDPRLNRPAEVIAAATTEPAAHRAAAEYLATLTGLDPETDEYLATTPLARDVLTSPTRVDNWMAGLVEAGSQATPIFAETPLRDAASVRRTPSSGDPTDDEDHQIVAIGDDEFANTAYWRCSCHYVHNGYDSTQEASYAAAEHQLPDDTQYVIARAFVERESIQSWRTFVDSEARKAADKNPDTWRWYLDIHKNDTRA